MRDKGGGNRRGTKKTKRGKETAGAGVNKPYKPHRPIGVDIIGAQN